ncbi:MAG: hypothetical protein Q8L55_13025, partial [Phycisphaerales bacterium]|nr:hypothetical protein [Phycisphaerales bacterium]
LLESEKDPALLSRLIATALRYKVTLPRASVALRPAPAAPAPAPPAVGAPLADADGRHAPRSAQPPAPSPRPPAPSAADDSDDNDDLEPFTPSGLQPLTEQELAQLKLQIGPVEAERRRLVRLHILKEEAARAAED